MDEFWILFFVSLFTTNSLDKAESVKVKLEETPLKTFDEIFGEGWRDKGEAEDLKTPAPTNFGQNVHHQIDRQNTQIGQIEPNSTDQEEQNQITSNQNNTEEKRRRKIIDKFNAIKDEFKQKGKYSTKEWVQIEKKIAKHLKFNRTKIFEWKKEFGISRKMFNEKEERKHLVKKFDQMKAELKRAGIKGSYNHEIDETVTKELGLTFQTIYAWKRELGQTASNEYAHSEQKELMKLYYEAKGKNPKISDENIAKMLNIGISTLYRWKKQFKRQQLHPNSVEKNAGSNVQEIENSNLGNI